MNKQDYQKASCDVLCQNCSLRSKNPSETFWSDVVSGRILANPDLLLVPLGSWAALRPLHCARPRPWTNMWLPGVPLEVGSKGCSAVITVGKWARVSLS